jgi:hypothetical protein
VLRKTGYLCTEGIKTVLNVLIAAVYLFNVTNQAGTAGTHGRYQQGDTGTNVWTGHAAAAQLALSVVTHDDGSMRVAENNLRTHVYQTVDEEQAALKHLLMKQHTATSLRSHDDKYAEQVRRQSGPWGVGQRHDGTIDE